jgi:hypothetical protein
MATGEPQTSSAVRVPAEPEIAAVQVIGQEALAELDVPVAQVELEALAGLEDQVVPVVRVALAVPESPVARVALVVPESPVVRVAPVVPEDPVVRVAPVAPEDPVVPEHDQVVVEPEHDQVAAALEHDQVEVVPGRDLVEVPRRTRSATERHLRDPAPVLAAEDSAAAAETTREPAATEAEKAWAVAVTVVAAAVMAE